MQFLPEVTVDSFERWIASGTIERFRVKGFDIDSMREQIARHEQAPTQACNQLFGTFYARTLLSTSADRGYS